jgi:two-component system LytT family response regulator/two-component system response regulator LytT
MIRCIIVDDETPARDELAWLLSGLDDIQVVGQAASAAEAIAQIASLTPDLVFLDIQMPGRNGFDVVAEILERGLQPLIVFTTAYDQYAVRAFEANALDYIQKPVSSERLAVSVRRARRRLTAPDADASRHQDLQSLLETLGIRRGPERVALESKGKIILMDLASILFFRFEDKSVLACLGDATLSVHGMSSIDQMEKRVGGGGFFRSNRAELVNLNHVRGFVPWFNGKYLLTMDDEAKTEIAVSRSRVKEFKTLLGI